MRWRIVRLSFRTLKKRKRFWTKLKKNFRVFICGPEGMVLEAKEITCPAEYACFNQKGEVKSYVRFIIYSKNTCSPTRQLWGFFIGGLAAQN